MRTPLHPAWVAHCLNEVIDADTIVVNEMGVPLDFLAMSEPRSYLSSSLAGGLGFGLGAAIGAKIGAPAKKVILLVGDGSYMFGCPTAAHYVGRAENLPTLTIVANNNIWFAVKSSTLGMYPNGNAAKANVMPLTELSPSPSFEKTI